MTTTDTTVAECVRLEIPPKAQFVSLCRLALTAICREHQFADDQIADLRLAITEACSNSILHAFDGADHDDSRVFITYEMLEDRLIIEVRDHGSGFEYEGANTDELPVGGLGISIIRAVCDELEFVTDHAEGGSALRLTKLRNVQESAA